MRVSTKNNNPLDMAIRILVTFDPKDICYFIQGQFRRERENESSGWIYSSFYKIIKI